MEESSVQENQPVAQEQEPLVKEQEPVEQEQKPNVEEPESAPEQIEEQVEEPPEPPAPKNPTFQIVDFDANYSLERTNDFIKASGIHACDYHTLAIIGCQSTGKSTIMNMLFGTDFHMLDAQQGRNQTTQGIWIAKDEQEPIIVLDLEGTDSQIRGAEGAAFEHMASLFALSMSNVLIVNLWTHEIGRYRAASVGLLKTIFEVNMKLFSDTPKQKIVFVLRDFNDENDNITLLKQQISKSMADVWAEIQKPPSHQLLSVMDCFSFDFHTVAVKDYKPEEFKNNVDDLGQRFKDPNHPEYLLRNVKNDLPVDGLALYYHEIWQIIQSEQDLNIPSQKILLASLRCNEIKNEAMTVFTQESADIRQKAGRTRIEAFGQACTDVINKALEFYDSQASRYAAECYQQIRDELNERMLDDLRDLFGKQLQKLNREGLETFKKKFLLGLDRKEPTENFAEKAQDMSKEISHTFQQEADQSLVIGSEWTFHETLEELEDELHTRVKEARDQQMELLQGKVDTAMKKLGNDVNKELGTTEDISIWERVFALQKAAMEELEPYVERILIGLAERGWGRVSRDIKENSTAEYVFKVRLNAFETLQKAITKFTQNLDTYITKKFVSWFKFMENGKPRDWRTAEIEELYIEMKDKALVIVYVFNLLKLVPNWTIWEPDNQDLSFEELMTEQEIDNIKEKFLRNAESEFNDAKERREFGRIVGGVPKWIWVILAAVSWNEIMWLLSSPTLMLPALGIVGIGAAFVFSGQAYIPTFFIRKILMLLKLY